MDITQALSTAANIMLLGMVCVFTFLSILVVAIKLLERFAGCEVEATPQAKPAPQQCIDNNIVAAISGAVHQYRQSNSNK